MGMELTEEQFRGRQYHDLVAALRTLLEEIDSSDPPTPGSSSWRRGYELLKRLGEWKGG